MIHRERHGWGTGAASSGDLHARPRVMLIVVVVPDVQLIKSDVPVHGRRVVLGLNDHTLHRNMRDSPLKHSEYKATAIANIETLHQRWVNGYGSRNDIDICNAPLKIGVEIAWAPHAAVPPWLWRDAVGDRIHPERRNPSRHACYERFGVPGPKFR